VACIRQIVPKHGFCHIPTPILSAPGMPEGWQAVAANASGSALEEQDGRAMGCIRAYGKQARLLALAGSLADDFSPQLCASRRVTGTLHWAPISLFSRLAESLRRGLRRPSLVHHPWVRKTGRVWRIEPMLSLQPYEFSLIVQIAFVFSCRLREKFRRRSSSRFHTPSLWRIKLPHRQRLNNG